VQRTADPDGFAERLEAPLFVDPSKITTQADLERDADSFVAFAGAMGVKLPQDRGLPSSPSSSAAGGN